MAVELPSSEAEVHALLQSAVSSRAFHIRRESQTITMANVRRLLESDLGLETSVLDGHKAFIGRLVDEVLLSSDNVGAQGEEDQKEVSEGVPQEISGLKRRKKSFVKKAREENGSVDDFKDVQEEDVQMEAKKKKQKKKGRTSSKEENEDGGGSTAEMAEQELDVETPKRKQRKEQNQDVIDSKEVYEDGSRSHTVVSEDDSDVSEVKKVKKVSQKNATVKPIQNTKIEHLKKIIKACGLSVPPQIYKRAKQQPEDKQDKFLIKELVDILDRRGLSSNPSDKEIKAVKQKIAREKDLEGIDTTNIILEPRGRRATSQFFVPVYNPPPVEYDSEEDSEEESEDGAEGSEEEECNDFAEAEDSEDSA